MRINLMTACLVAGDAIGNYIEMLRSNLARRHEVAVYADRGTGERPFLPAWGYTARPAEILWFHYSIYSENFAVLDRRGPEFKIMDFHGVCPPEHFEQDEHELKRLTARALDELPRKRHVFDLCLAHSDYSVRVLQQAGYARVVKTPLAIGRALADAPEHPHLARLLPQLEYLLFVGRVVKQKDVLGVIEVFARVRQKRPGLKLWVIGDRTASPLYQKQIEDRLTRLGIERDVGFTGRLTDPALLRAFLRHAALMVILSRWESFCVPVVEAMGFGVPTATSESCVAEIIGDSGLIVPAGNYDAAAAQIAALLADRGRYDALRRRCLERAPYFTESHMMATLEAVEKEHFPAGQPLQTAEKKPHERNAKQ
ncbi:MAG: glycosyltransferase family 4 protein [Candidatus Sumerlaeia bacterium]|nr:glycosyltransferase family 4 protein [Candidatus Sumerlaeia bacterium]